MSIEPVFKEPAKQSSGDNGTPRRKTKRQGNQGIEPRQFVRKPFYVTGVQVTDDNIHEVATWCGGLVQENGEGKQFIKVHTTKAMYERQTRAIPGDWVLKAGNSWKVYTNKAFNEVFEEDFSTDEPTNAGGTLIDANPTSTLSPEAREALLMVAENIKNVAS